MNALERFLKYVAFDTRSDENSGTHPSSEKEKLLGAYLVRELLEIGLADASMDDHGYVSAHLLASEGRGGIPAVGLIAHMDTSPDAPGENVKPRVIKYDGGIVDIGNGVSLDPGYYENLAKYAGREIVVTDGSTLLGADDKAGVAEIVSAMERLINHPEIPHGPVAVCFTPDEEIGGGTDFFNLESFGAETAYTVDGGRLGEIEYENFNAANASVFLRGINVHPGDAKNKMRNAILIANEFINMMPPAETPAHTEGYEGFFHINRIEGTETEASVYMLIRDHDRAKFDERKRRLGRIAAYLNSKYGRGAATLYISDSYFNMREMIEPHMELIDRAKRAFSRTGIEPRTVPVRGGTDGAKLSFMGLPCPNLSTGGENFHCVQEFIPADALEKMTEVLVELVRAE
ncbi:MAG: peptidase T [Oscillospiraceae bacterium]|nr:peptidase T [Oscillospiraceae bacterium]